MGTFPPHNALIEVEFRRQASLPSDVCKETRDISLAQKGVWGRKNPCYGPRNYIRTFSGLLTGKRSLSSAFLYHVILRPLL